MSRKNKLLQKAINNPDDLLFSDLETLLKQLEWVFKRQSGSHAIWQSPKGDRLVIQNNNGKAKGYQVKQLINKLNTEELQNER